MKKSFIAIIALVLVVIIIVSVVSCSTCGGCSTPKETETELRGSATGNQDIGNYTAIARGKISIDKVNVRKAAGTDSDIVAGLYKGDIIDIISTENGWAKIYYVGEYYQGFGYVSTTCFTYLTDDETESKKENETDTKKETEKETSKETSAPIYGDETDASGNIVFRTVNDYVVVTSGTTLLNVRSTPDSSSDTNIVGKAENGKTYKRVGISEFWSKIVFDNAEYYVSNKYIIHKPATDETVTKASVITDSLNIRSSLDYNADNQIGQVSKDEDLTVIFYDKNAFNGWARVYYKNGSTEVEGWVNAKYISIGASSETETQEAVG